jgi:two-component system, NtrC family, nitrogen regulation sensor histidine kinase NtrY
MPLALISLTGESKPAKIGDGANGGNKNAVEAMENQSLFRKITVRTRENAETLLAEVIDSGPGIAPENREIIFQSRYTTKGADGAGMGLYLTRQIVRAHGGTIDVYPTDGAGAHFVLSFPKAIDGGISS